MNGTPEANDPQAARTGAYTGAPGQGTASAAGGYTAGPGTAGYDAAAGPGYNAAGANYTGPAADAYSAPGYVPPPPGYAPPYGYPAPPPPVPGSPNPGLALVLGFIPGVGAMYNGQFAKGVVHIVIFAVLTKVAEHVDVFGIFVAGWIFYMIFDAYQTARARRDGLVAPDPFGLNNIGERFGMPHNPNWGDFVARPAPGSTAAADPARTSNPYAGPPVDAATGAAAGGTYSGPSSAYGSAAAYAGTGSPYVWPVPPAPYPPGTMPPTDHPDYPEAVRRQVIADMGGAPTGGYQATYAPIDPAAMPPYPPQPVSGVPTGAIWLIGLGVLALAGSLAHNFYWRGYFFGAATCFIFGVILLIQQTAATRKLYQPGTAAYQWSLLHQARLGIILILIGVLQTIAGAHLTSWHYLWPYLLIVFGLLQLADRSLYNRMLLDPPVFQNAYAPVNPGPAGSASAAASSAASSNTAEGEVR
ncbi:hypothetical protein [Terriglobus sp.]|uniref:hypothetical protein n=1 Tax=Terriglobus sp. TaxID=1889013 RepID=UPI003AFFA821